jgi:hypothetical protein
MHTKYSCETQTTGLEEKRDGGSNEVEQRVADQRISITNKHKRERFINMVSIPIFAGTANSDPEKFLKQFKRACLANGDKDSSSWLELLPIHLDDEASWWYEAQTKELLTKGLITEFQQKESCQLLMNKLNVIKQKDGEKLREYSTRIKELKAHILWSQRKIAGADEVDQSKADATIASTESVVLRNFIRGLQPSLRDIVSWKQPKTFEAVFALAQKKETILADLSQLEPLVVETPSFTTTVQATVIPQRPMGMTSSSQMDALTKLVEKFKELKLFVI